MKLLLLKTSDKSFFKFHIFSQPFIFSWIRDFMKLYFNHCVAYERCCIFVSKSLGYTIFTTKAKIRVSGEQLFLSIASRIVPLWLLFYNLILFMNIVKQAEYRAAELSPAYTFCFRLLSLYIQATKTLTHLSRNIFIKCCLFA